MSTQLDQRVNLNEPPVGNNMPMTANLMDMRIHEVIEDDDVNKSNSGVNEPILEPYNGMEFNSHKEAHDFYQNYAKLIGFGISIIASRRSKTLGHFIDYKFACTRYGVKRSTNAVNPRSSLKMNCGALLHVKRKIDGKWYIDQFVKEHNHDLVPDQALYFPCHRGLSSSDKAQINTLNAVGIPPSRIYAALAKQSGGHMNLSCLEKDIRNYIDKERRLTSKLGDANVMLEQFVIMQQEDPNFFYAIDLDDDCRLKSVFWVDSKGRDDYTRFGDVVSFDTTYITNAYRMPFAPFIGVNNHFQSAILGCALLADESTASFTWVMKTWLRAMGGQAPKAILTDQDRAIRAAIAIVFPNAKHRFCLWHIMRKVPEKIGHVTQKYENFMAIFKRCVYRSWMEEEFESSWRGMIESFGLREEEWLLSLYEDRKYWVPTFMRDTFFAGMSTTQRSESINSFFDKYVNKKTTLKEFVDKYKMAIEDRGRAEKAAHFQCQKIPPLRTASPFEKQMSAVYTHAIFVKFQDEILGVSGCYSTKQNEDDDVITFKVRDFKLGEEFMVAWNGKNEELQCLCRSFEYRGILCRHCLSVLHNLGIFSIPGQYVLDRWKKGEQAKTVRPAQKHVESKEQRRRDISILTAKINEEASLCPESYNFVYPALEEILKKCDAINKSYKESMIRTGKENYNILDPRVCKNKGAPSKRIKSGCEIASKKGLKKQKRKVLGDINNSRVQQQANLENQLQGHSVVSDTILGSQSSRNFTSGFGHGVTNGIDTSIVRDTIEMFPELTNLMTSDLNEHLLSQAGTSEYLLDNHWYQ